MCGIFFVFVFFFLFCFLSFFFFFKVQKALCCPRERFFGPTVHCKGKTAATRGWGKEKTRRWGPQSSLRPSGPQCLTAPGPAQGAGEEEEAAPVPPSIPRTLTHPRPMLPASSLSSDVPAVSPLLPAPAVTAGQSSLGPPGLATPPGRGRVGGKAPAPGEPAAPWPLPPRAARTQWGEKEGVRPRSPQPGEGKCHGGGTPSWRWHGGVRFVPALLPLPWRDLDPQALC